MTNIVQFETSSGSLLSVEVTEKFQEQGSISHVGRRGENVIVEAKQDFSSAIEPLREVAESVLHKIGLISEPPNVIEIQFGLKANIELGVMVVSGTLEANYIVKMQWSKNSKEDKEQT